MLIIALLFASLSFLLSFYSLHRTYQQNKLIDDLALSLSGMLNSTKEIVKLYEGISQSQQLHSKGFSLLAENQRETTKDLNTLKEQVGEGFHIIAEHMARTSR